MYFIVKIGCLNVIVFLQLNSMFFTGIELIILKRFFFKR